MKDYEYYREKYKVVEWRDDSVLISESLGCDWYSETELNDNDVEKTGVFYVIPDRGDELNIRVKKG